MDEPKRKRLEEKGWKVETVSEFLELTPENIPSIDELYNTLDSPTVPRFKFCDRTSTILTLKHFLNY